MKRKILVPMFASVMALTMNTLANADEVKNTENIEEKTSQGAIELDKYQESTYKQAKVKDGVAVKVRSEGEVKLVAYTGDNFKVTGTQGEWVEVELESGKGWIPARFVDVESAPAFVTEEKVNFRKESNTDSDIISELAKGDKLKVLEVEENWVKVKNGDEEGYVSAKYLSDEEPVIEEVVVEQSSEVTQTNESSKTNTSQKNNTSSNSTSSNSTSNKTEQSDVPAANTSLAQAVVNLAYSKIGSPYVWGAEGPNSFDCSGLTSYVYKNAAGISIPRSSSAQAGYGKTVSKSDLQPGDLVFFGSGSVSHVGIYIGGGNMIHSPKPGDSVKITSINSSYYSGRFITAKRVL